MAQDSPQIGFVRRAIATIKAWLRKHIPGFMGMKMTDDEIITRFILPARNFVVNGGPNGGPGGGVRFNRNSDSTQDNAVNRNQTETSQLSGGLAIGNLPGSRPL